MHWQREEAVADRLSGPLWVVLGDSAGQAIGVVDPDQGYVGRVLRVLSGRDRVPWRVVNLSSTGALIADVVLDQLPRLRARATPADLVTCGVGANEVLRASPRRLRSRLDELAAALPAGSVLLTLPGSFRGIGAPYLRWLNTGIRVSAARHGHLVAEVDRWFGPPWRGKFSQDWFHPSERGYADWSAAVLAAVDASTPPATPPAAPPDATGPEPGN